MFSEGHIFVYYKRTNYIKNITEEVKGNLPWMRNGTSTVVKDRVINTGRDGTYAFYPKELRCETLNENLK